MSAAIYLGVDKGPWARNDIQTHLFTERQKPINITQTREIIDTPGGRMVAPIEVEINGVIAGPLYFQKPILPQIRGRQAKVVERSTADDDALTVDQQAVLIVGDRRWCINTIPAPRSKEATESDFHESSENGRAPMKKGGNLSPAPSYILMTTMTGVSYFVVRWKVRK
jgi:hypothetical protein